MVTVQAEDGRSNLVFRAIADPIRRSILDLILHRERSAGEIAKHFAVSRPAVAKHVRVLREAGLLRERRRATMRYYSLDVQVLKDVDVWLSQYRLFWAARLVDLKRVVEEEVASQSPARRRRKSVSERNSP